MKTTIRLSVLALALIFGACNNSSNKSGQTTSPNKTQQYSVDTTRLKTGEAYYQCPMHPEVISDNPGSCPKCGMNLQKVLKQ